MRRLTTVLFLMLATTAACGKKGGDAKDQCEKIYQKGDGTHAYTTDKAKFLEACQKTEDNTRRCLLLSGEEQFKDDSCGPGHGNTFRESMALMQLGQGGK